MKVNKDNWVFLIFSVLFIFFSFIVTNVQIQKLLKQPFSNVLFSTNQTFASPSNILFFSSGLIWGISLIVKNCMQCCCSKVLTYQKQAIQKNKLRYTRALEIQPDSLDTEGNIEKLSTANAKGERVLVINMSDLDVIKIVIPNFLSTVFFLYGILYLSFPKAMIFNITIKLGLVNLYQSIFETGQFRCSKFVISIVTFFGFGIFNFYLDSNQGQQYEITMETVLGYLFLILMAYLSAIKNILEKDIQKSQGKISSIDKVIMESKANFMLAYFLSLLLKEEVIGFVFAWLHYGFIKNMLIFTAMLLIGRFLQKFLSNNFSDGLSNFIVSLQKNTSIILSLAFFGNGVNGGLITGIVIILFMSFVNFILDFVDLEDQAFSDKGQISFQRSFQRSSLAPKMDIQLRNFRQKEGSEQEQANFRK